MTQPIVSDAGPIITFARAGKLDLLKEVIGNLQIPQAVYDEVVVKGAGKPGAHEVKSADWIQQQTCEDLAESVDLPVNLGKGEKEAIVLSVQRGACLLVDDPVARREARNTEYQLSVLLMFLTKPRTGVSYLK